MEPHASDLGEVTASDQGSGRHVSEVDLQVISLLLRRRLSLLRWHPPTGDPLASSHWPRGRPLGNALPLHKARNPPPLIRSGRVRSWPGELVKITYHELVNGPIRSGSEAPGTRLDLEIQNWRIQCAQGTNIYTLIKNQKGSERIRKDRIKVEFMQFVDQQRLDFFSTDC